MDNKEIEEFVETSEAAKMIWNAAIEAAIEKCLYPVDKKQIRSLKK